MLERKEHVKGKVTFDVDEAADMLKVHRNTVLKLAEKGDLPAAKIGRAWVFIVENLVTWLKNTTNDQVKERKELHSAPKRSGGGRRQEPPRLPDISLEQSKERTTRGGSQDRYP